MMNADKSKTKNSGLAAITIFHLVAAVMYIAVDSVVVKKIGVPAPVASLISLALLFITGISSLIITLVLKKKNNLTLVWVVLNLGASALFVFGSTLLSGINITLVNILWYALYYVALYLTAFASAKGYKKKKTKDPYGFIHEDIDVKPTVHEEIYNEFGNFGK